MDPALIWAQFFANLAGFNMHPGNFNRQRTLEELAIQADQMMIHYLARYKPEKTKWPSSQES